MCKDVFSITIININKSMNTCLQLMKLALGTNSTMDKDAHTGISYKVYVFTVCVLLFSTVNYDETLF